MTIQQFEDKPMSHYAYAIINNQKMVLIDPARNPQVYYDFAAKHHATIVGVIETHPHADFVSSHAEIAQTTGAAIYASQRLGASYAHIGFDDGNAIDLGDGVCLKALNTPGHSPDSICVLLENNGSAVAVFTGDTLFIGDCGRPDLRETTGNITATRHTLAADMYHSLRNQLMPLPDQVQVYPAHGAGSLCGKALSTANSSTIAAEKQTNWCLQPQTEAEFVAELIADQPFVPKYFGYNVEINKKGADHYQKNIEKIAHLGQIYQKNAADILDKNTIIIDTRPQDIYNAGNFDNSINLMIGGKFETWLGSIVAPHQNFYLTAENQQQIDELISRIAKIGYETQIKATFIGIYDEKQAVNINVQQFIDNKADYTIVDIRNVAEARQKPIFDNALHIPLAELSDRTHEIPTHKPIVVHCAGGYRSAAGASIIKNNITNNIKNNQDTNPNKAVIVYDLGVAITQF